MDDPARFLPLSPHQFHILLALTDSERHGYGVIQDVEQRTGGELRLGTGTLYTAIARLVELGLIADAGRAPQINERRRYYRLTPLGRSVLRAEASRLDALLRHARARGVRPSAAPALARRS
jgi:DNA-binding PadR family transcriptional regulator